jgi:hypothetical protein
VWVDNKKGKADLAKLNAEFFNAFVNATDAQHTAYTDFLNENKGAKKPKDNLLVKQLNDALKVETSNKPKTPAQRAALSKKKN